jgi:predicted amidohydrolase YtcJ
LILHVAWCAVNRVTPKGRLLGAAECLSVPEALHAITLGAAYTLHLDGEVGSIEVGKRADFCVLRANPLTESPERLKDIEIWGTVLSGKVFPATP